MKNFYCKKWLAIIWMFIILEICCGSECYRGQWLFENIENGENLNGIAEFQVHGGRLDELKIICGDGVDYSKDADIQYNNGKYEIMLDTSLLPNGKCSISTATISDRCDADSPKPYPNTVDVVISNK